MSKKMAGESTIFTRQAPEGFDPEKPYADGLTAWKQKEYVAREKFVGIETSKVKDLPDPLSLVATGRPIAWF